MYSIRNIFRSYAQYFGPVWTWWFSEKNKIFIKDFVKEVNYITKMLRTVNSMTV